MPTICLYPSGYQIIQELLPKPDLAHSMQKLEKLLHQIYRAFPQKHWGNSRDAFCFRRVQIPIETFKVRTVQASHFMSHWHNFVIAMNSYIRHNLVLVNF